MATIPTDVRKDMAVYDSEDSHIGKVGDVKFGDEGAATTAGAEPPRGNRLVEEMIDAIWPDDMPEAERAQLQRAGYVLLDADGFLQRDRYIRAEQIGGVAGDRLTLNVRREDLIRA